MSKQIKIAPGARARKIAAKNAEPHVAQLRDALAQFDLRMGQPDFSQDDISTVLAATRDFTTCIANVNGAWTRAIVALRQRNGTWKTDA